MESSNNVEMILKFFDMFLKLKDLTSSDAFKEHDPDGKGKPIYLYLYLHKTFPFMDHEFKTASDGLSMNDHTGVISKRDFHKAMESHKHYTQTETEFLLSCTETDENELLDYEEFVERFHEPAKVNVTELTEGLVSKASINV